MLTNRDKLNLLNFILRTGMYITTADENNIVSFIHGYEFGLNGECDFTEQLKIYLVNHLKISSSSDGWSGQITRYSRKKSIPWAVAFKQLGLEILASDEIGGLNDQMQQLIKVRVNALITRIDDANPWLNGSWVEECVALFAIKSIWFKSLWTTAEYQSLKSIRRTIDQGRFSENSYPFKPTKALLDLKNKFSGT
jgi:hypothetical protein